MSIITDTKTNDTAEKVDRLISYVIVYIKKLSNKQRYQLYHMKKNI